MSNLSDWINLEHRDDGTYLLCRGSEFLIHNIDMQRDESPSHDYYYDRESPWYDFSIHALERHVEVPVVKPKRRLSDLGLRRPE